MTPGSLKRIGLHVCRALGLFALARWLMHGRLLILCYHGIAQADESAWRPKLFMRRDTFARRMETLARLRLPVVGLDAGLSRVRAAEPYRVAITFDDGFQNFYSLARPILLRHGYPATVYVATYYCLHPDWPVFDLVVDYMLWKGAGRGAPGALIGEDEPLRSGAREGRERSVERIYAFAERAGLDGAGKEALARRLGEALGVSYEAMVGRRMLCLMSLTELEKASRDGIGLELHTHRHDIPNGALAAEISRNREVLETVGVSGAAHFCYPSGQWDRSMWAPLRTAGIRSATTCESGIVTATTERLALPRFLDSETVSAIEFEGWVSGFMPVVKALRTRLGGLIASRDRT